MFTCLGLAAAVLALCTRGFPELEGAGTSPYTDGTLQYVHIVHVLHKPNIVKSVSPGNQIIENIILTILSFFVYIHFDSLFTVDLVVRTIFKIKYQD